MEAMEAPTPNNFYEKDIKEIIYLKDEFSTKFNNEIYNIKIGTLNEFLVVKVTNKSNLKLNYISYFTYEELKNISKSMRYFDNIGDIVTFMEEKGKKNELLMKEENKNIYIEFKIISPNGKEDTVLLELKPQKISDKEIISFLVKKVEYLEKEVEILKEKLNKAENIISKNKTDILFLFEEVNNIKNNFKKEIDSKITNINQIDFIVKRLKQSPVIYNKNFEFKLLYRGTRDGDDTIKLHKKCDGKKNVIIFMRSEEGKNYGGFSNIGWEERPKDKWEYPIDDNAFLFSVDSKRIFNAKKGKNQICWLNSDEYGLSFYCSLTFYNKFLTKENINVGGSISSNFENCSKYEFNSGKQSCKLSELEVFQII